MSPLHPHMRSLYPSCRHTSPIQKAPGLPASSINLSISVADRCDVVISCTAPAESCSVGHMDVRDKGRETPSVNFCCCSHTVSKSPSYRFTSFPREHICPTQVLESQDSYLQKNYGEEKVRGIAFGAVPNHCDKEKHTFEKGLKNHQVQLGPNRPSGIVVHSVQVPILAPPS